MKQYYFLAASLVALASCSSDDFVGGNGGDGTEGNNVAIRFDGDAGKITRATSNTGTTAQMLDGQFKVYGVKSGATAGSNLTDVFKNYSVWDNTDKTTSNTNGWEYVGASGSTDLGTGNISLTSDQTIKYWDYSAADYRFVAGSPISAFSYKVNSDNVIEKAQIKGLGGHINVNTSETALATNPVYVASPVIVEKSNTNYKNPIKFDFIRQQAMVRVGVYETIPGYNITDIKFYAYDTDGNLKVTTGNNVILTSTEADYFVGGTDVLGTITYDWNQKSFSLAYTDGTLTKQKNWYAGALNGVKATTSNHATVSELYGTDKDMSDNGYFTVLPTPTTTTASAIQIKCDYTLTSVDGSGETIKVTGATAAIPAAFSKWEQNTLYTYIFKISQNTNGTTGGAGDPVGLFPITFDAAVTTLISGAIGTTTTFTTPSITTIQEGSIDNNGVIYHTGKTIYGVVTKTEDGTAIDVTIGTTTEGNVQVYKSTTEVTEADLQVESIAQSILIDGNIVETTLEEYNSKHGLKFTPTEEGYYIIQYVGNNGVKTYKVIKVVAAS